MPTQPIDRRRLPEDESRDSMPRPSEGFVRWWDVRDTESQAVAPLHPHLRYDRSGEKAYEAGLRRFERQQGDDQDHHGPAPTNGRSHAGRGPRGYVRSDERITDDVCMRLTEAPDVDATDIEVSVESGVVTLAGRVDDRAAKRRAEDIAAEAGGVVDVFNRLTVSRSDAEPISR